MSLFIGLIVLVLTSGCADPFTRLIKDNKYVPITPIPEIQHIGDIYRTIDLHRTPVLLMRDIFTKDQNEEFMKSLRGRVTLPTVSGDSKFELKAEADVIGYAKSELSAFNVKKFKVKIGGVYQYIISEDRFERELYTKIKEKRPNKNFSGNYVVLALLQATIVEYELIDENGAKIVIKSGGEIERIVKAKLGAEWKANENQNLSISEASYVGYRIGKISEIVGSDPKSVRPLFMILSPLSTGKNKSLLKPIVIEEVPPEELRKALKAKSISS